MPAIGLPLALVLGALAELVAGLVRAGFHGEALQPFREVWADLRRTTDRRDRATLLELLGAGAALSGCGLVAASAVGAAPGSLPLLYLSLGLGVAGAHLVAIEASTRPAGGRARGRLLQSLSVEAALAAALAVGFLRWQAGDLSEVWGVRAVLGTAFEVGPVPAAIGEGLAILALLAAAAFRIPVEPEVRRGRLGRPGGGGVLLRVSRWALAGATAVLAPALVAGLDLTRSPVDLDLALWVGAALAAALVLGAVGGWSARLPDRLRMTLLAPAVTLLAAAGVVLVVVT